MSNPYNPDAKHRAYCGLPVNWRCDNFSLHRENVEDWLLDGPAHTEDEKSRVDAEAELEYLCCDGH
jgi:hypothetical protein